MTEGKSAWTGPAIIGAVVAVIGLIFAIYQGTKTESPSPSEVEELSVQLSPNTAYTGALLSTVVTVSVSGLTNGEKFRVTFDDNPVVDRVAVGNGGTAAFTVRHAATPSGTHTVTVKGLSSGLDGSAAFYVP